MPAPIVSKKSRKELSFKFVVNANWIKFGRVIFIVQRNASKRIGNFMVGIIGLLRKNEAQNFFFFVESKIFCDEG